MCLYTFKFPGKLARNAQDCAREIQGGRSNPILHSASIETINNSEHNICHLSIDVISDWKRDEQCIPLLWSSGGLQQVFNESRVGEYDFCININSYSVRRFVLLYSAGWKYYLEKTILTRNNWEYKVHKVDPAEWRSTNRRSFSHWLKNPWLYYSHQWK